MAAAGPDATRPGRVGVPPAVPVMGSGSRWPGAAPNADQPSGPPEVVGGDDWPAEPAPLETPPAGPPSAGHCWPFGRRPDEAFAGRSPRASRRSADAVLVMSADAASGRRKGRRSSSSAVGVSIRTQRSVSSSRWGSAGSRSRRRRPSPRGRGVRPSECDSGMSSEGLVGDIAAKPAMGSAKRQIER
jgi:hypothetical protein